MFESLENKTVLYSDTLVPDVFISEYLPSMESDWVKVYICCLFLNKTSTTITITLLSKKLAIPINTVKYSISSMQNMGIILKNNTKIELVDLKEKEILRIFRLKTTSTPDEAVKDKSRNKVIVAINNSFFQGNMSPSWYTDIDNWFDLYKFDHDVMLQLFQHCYDHKGLTRQYISKVAENWHLKNIHNTFELEAHFTEYEKVKDIRYKIVKKLNIKRYLTSYEEEYLEKWVSQYNFSMDIIDLAFKRTAGFSNPNFSYVDKILTTWKNNNLSTPESIAAYESTLKSKKVITSTTKSNFKQRKYNKKFFDDSYEEV